MLDSYVYHTKYTDAEALAAAKAGAGVANGDLIQADATGLPVIDGSQLTGLSSTFAGLSDAILVRKASDESLNYQDNLQNDDELLFASGANDVWFFFIFVIHVAGTTPDLKHALSLPTGGTAYMWDSGYWRATGAEAQSDATGTSVCSGTTGTRKGMRMTYLYVGGGTAGNVQFQWAQNVSDATATVVKANSCIIAFKLA